MARRNSKDAKEASRHERGLQISPEDIKVSTLLQEILHFQE